jgi:hypothetical protein
VNSPSSHGEEHKLVRVPKNVFRLMVAIVIVLFLVALYANVQRWHRNQLETVTFTPAPAVSPSPATP